MMKAVTAALTKKAVSNSKGRAGLNEREAPEKIVTARPLNVYRNCVAFHVPSFQLCRSTGQKVKTDTIWQPTIQRQLWVNMYGGLDVVNFFKQKVYHKQNDIFATVILHNNLFCHRPSDGLHCTSHPFIRSQVIRLAGP